MLSRYETKSVNKRWNGGRGYNPSKVDYKKSKVSLEGEYLRSFSSADEAEKFTSVSRGAILRCCKGKVKRAGNFIWRYYGKGI